MKNTRMMYLRQGNMFKEFFVERRNQAVSASGRPTNEFITTMESLKGCLAEADPKEVMNWQQLQTPVTHTIVQEGSPKAKKNERLRLDNRTFDINHKKIILENIISILEDNIPLENKGSGMENLIKTQIALDKSNSKLDVIMIVEPENHLCYTNLQQMLSTINSYSKDSQLIITTHNSMIASRLDLRNILWIELIL